MPTRTETQQQHRRETEQKVSDMLSYITRGVETYALWNKLHNAEVEIRDIHWSTDDTFVVSFADIGYRDVRDDPIIVLNRAHVPLHDLVSTLEAFVALRQCDISDIEVLRSMWSCDNKLAITIYVDR